MRPDKRREGLNFLTYIYLYVKNVLVSRENLGEIPRLVGRDYLQSRVKEGMEIGVAGVMALATLPIQAGAILVVRVMDGNPVLISLRGDLPGKRNREFCHRKIRTMVPGAQNSEVEVMEGRPVAEVKRKGEDPRITRVGRFLRRLSIDELPQLYQVLRGELALVGPRAPVRADLVYMGLHPENRDLYDEYGQMWDSGVMPGITGMAMVRGRADISFEDRIRWDLWYAENACLGLDLDIILSTFTTVISRKGAY